MSAADHSLVSLHNRSHSSLCVLISQLIRHVTWQPWSYSLGITRSNTTPGYWPNIRALCVRVKHSSIFRMIITYVVIFLKNLASWIIFSLSLLHFIDHWWDFLFYFCITKIWTSLPICKVECIQTEIIFKIIIIVFKFSDNIRTKAI